MPDEKKLAMACQTFLKLTFKGESDRETIEAILRMEKAVQFLGYQGQSIVVPYDGKSWLFNFDVAKDLKFINAVMVIVLPA